VDKNVDVPAGMQIGCDPVTDQELFRVTKNGVVIVPKEMPLQEEPKAFTGRGS
jgi:ADP-glucose pyrophosphorylase